MSVEAPRLQKAIEPSTAIDMSQWSFIARERREAGAASQSRESLNRRPEPLLSAPMKLLLAFLVWIAMGAVLVKGLLMAVNGSMWLLVVGLVGFIVLVGKIGCLSHD